MEAFHIGQEVVVLERLICDSLDRQSLPTVIHCDSCTCPVLPNPC